MTSFQIRVPYNDIIARVETARKNLVAGKSEVMEAIGVQVLSVAQRDYRTLSRGGTSSDGRTWKKLDPKTIKRKASRGRKAGRTTRTFSGNILPKGNVSAIGIDTGLQFASGSPGFIGDANGGNVFVTGPSSITVGYGRRYSKYFDAVRKLMPDVLPDNWRKSIDRVVAAWVKKIVAGIGSK